MLAKNRSLRPSALVFALGCGVLFHCLRPAPADAVNSTAPLAAAVDSTPYGLVYAQGKGMQAQYYNSNGSSTAKGGHKANVSFSRVAGATNWLPGSVSVTNDTGTVIFSKGDLQNDPTFQTSTTQHKATTGESGFTWNGQAAQVVTSVSAFTPSHPLYALGYRGSLAVYVLSGGKLAFAVTGWVKAGGVNGITIVDE